jgi:DNA-binding CsgD family transcriptional regulator
MDQGSKTLLKGLLVVLTLALSKHHLLDVTEIDETILISSITVLTLMFSRERSAETFQDSTALKYVIKESHNADPVLAENTLNTIQSTLTHLTAKESDVLSLMAKGLLNNETARKLAENESTVRNSLNSVLRKLNTGLTNNTVVKAVKQGFSNVKNTLEFNHYHKGSACFYQAILCQEGWCANCIIYQEKSSKSSTALSRS